MAEYRRRYQPGGTYFFTLITHRRRQLFTNALARDLLHQAIQKEQEQRPFEIPAMILLPEHLHCIWKLPDDDSAYDVRWACIKKDFTKHWLQAGGRELPVSPNRAKRREKGVWQRRFWEHTIRDEDDYMKHVNYIHYNPVKHGLAECPHQWPYSSFHRWSEEGYYNSGWLCSCKRNIIEPPDFGDIEGSVGE